MADTGTLYPGTVTTAAVAPYDDFDWTNPTNVLADDTNYASITDSAFDTGAQSYLMYVRNFGSSVPSTGTITGVKVEIGKYYVTGVAKDGTLQLINGIGTTLGTSLADLATNWPTTAPGTTVYGGSTTLWGATLTPAIVNGTSFGLQFAGSAAGNNCDAYVDYIRMVIYYNAPTTLWNVTVAEDNQAQKSDLAAMGVWYPLTGADNAQAQASDLASLGVWYPLTAADGNQAQASDEAVVTFGGATYNPQTGLLDDFNRADENPLNPALWDGPFQDGQGLWKIASNQAVPVG